MSRSRKLLGGLDMYRKVPVDLMEGTKRGSFLSLFALTTICILVFLETKAYFTKSQVVDLQLDTSSEPRIRVNFNISMLDLRCEWANVDVVSALGTDQNITAHLTKWAIDSEGVRQKLANRKKTPDEISLKDETVTESIEELHQNGEDAVSFNENTLQYARDENDYLFVDFYASWCNHCRDLAPTWEALAELMLDASDHRGNQHPDDVTAEDYQKAEKVQVPVMVGKVDCVDHHDLCLKQGIRAYPTLRLFVDGQPWKEGDYRGHRTLLNMVEWLYLVELEHKEHMDESERQLHLAHQAARERLGEDESEEQKQWHEKILQQRKGKVKSEATWIEAEHPGCNIAGHLLLDRTPGNFHIQARSQNQEFAAHLTNVSHMVHTLTVGDIHAKRLMDTGRGDMVPKDVVAKIAPINDNLYIAKELHESYHHYLKLVSTEVEGFKYGKIPIKIFQILENSQLAYYRKDMIPEAKFIYDLSPIAVSYRSESRHWYDFCTSIMAIIGGVFTVIGFFESGINVAVKTSQKRRLKKTAPTALATPYR